MIKQLAVPFFLIWVAIVTCGCNSIIRTPEHSDLATALPVEQTREMPLTITSPVAEPSKTAILSAISTVTLTPTPISVANYYWPSSLTTGFRINQCNSQLTENEFQLEITAGPEEKPVEITIASGSLARGMVVSLPPCEANSQMVTVRGQAGCVYQDDFRGIRLSWQEGEIAYVYTLYPLYQAAPSEMEKAAILAVNSLESINHDEFQYRLAPWMPPTVTPSGPLIYFWPSKLPDGWYIEPNGSRIDESSYSLRIVGDNGSVDVSGGGTWIHENCNKNLELWVVRGQPGYLNRGTGAGSTLIWRENGHPYVISGMSLGPATLNEIADVLEPLDRDTWLGHLAQIP